jgi:cysteine synthase A
VSEAYFASLLGLRFIAVMPKTTSQSKIDLIKFYFGECHLVEKASDVYSASEALAEELGGHFMNQFKYASVATDWRGENNIAASIFRQLSLEPYSIPEWIVCGAGTGGTSSTISRFAKLKNYPTRLCVADPENSVFYHYWKTGDKELQSAVGSKIEGIGRPRVEKAFIRESVSEMIYVPDNYSIAAMHVLESIIGKKVGPSTGTNFYAMLLLSEKMIAEGTKGSIVGLLCDSGERYISTYYNSEWLNQNNFSLDQAKQEIRDFLQSGTKLPTWEAPPLKRPGTK